MRDSILVDANVWIDFYIPRRKGHGMAKRLVNGCLEADYALFVAASSLSDIFYNLQRETKETLRADSGDLTELQSRFAKDYTWECMDGMLSIVTVVGVDQGEAWLAQKHRAVHDDFEDDLLIAAALRAQPDYLVTNDLALLRHCPYAAVDVEDAIKLLEL